MIARRALLTAGLTGLVAGAVATTAGCSAATSSATASSSASVIPSDGQTLAAMGVTHGPTNFALPYGVVPSRTIDQYNVVTLVFSADDGSEIYHYLANNLERWGWTITGDANQSLVFNQTGWDGGFTVSKTVSGLTLRVLGL